MKIDRLDFLAFGSFTNMSLDFTSRLPGLHVVYGPNEAGKSTALRGLLALLFGFHSRTPDNFLHPYTQLVVGGQLQGPDGTELIFRRRKKAKNDLFDIQDNPLGPEVLTPFLRGLDQETFSRMHGIDHDRLIHGGQGILEQQGEVGQALFSAGAGFASIRAVLSTLEQEADTLFRPRASKTELGQAISHYKELQSQMRQVLLDSKDWKKHHQALKQAQKAHQDVLEQQRGLAREIRQLEQVHQALPYLAQRQDVQEKLQALGTVQALPDDFSQRRLEQEERIARSKVALEGLLARYDACKVRLAQLQPDQSILEQAEGIEDLQQRLGAYRKAQDDRPRLEGQRISSKTEASRILRLIRPELSLEKVETLRPILLKRKTVLSLEQEHALAEQKLVQAQKQRREAAQDVQRLGQELAALPKSDDWSFLAQAVTLAHKAGDLDDLVGKLDADLHQRTKRAQSRLNGLGLWCGELAALPGLVLPLEETIADFETRLDQVRDQVQQILREKARLEEEEKTLLREMMVFEQGQGVPDAQELQHYRARREQGWSLVQRAWLEGEDVTQEAQSFDPVRPLSKAYMASVVDADRFADTMYQEAERVQKYTALNTQLGFVHQERDACMHKLENFEKQQEEMLQKWRQVWHANHIEPLSPREMRSWLMKVEAVRTLAEEITILQHEVQVQDKKRQDMIKVLQDALSLPAQESLDFLTILHQAEEILEKKREAQRARASLAELVREKERFVARCQVQEDEASEALRKIIRHWQNTMTDLGFPQDTKPGEASDYIENLQKMFTTLEEVHALAVRQEGIDRDALDFETRVRALALELELQEESQDLILLVARLKSRLQHALHEQTLQEQQIEEISALDKEISALKARQKAEEDGLSLFLAQVGVTSLAESIEVEERWQRFQTLRTRGDEMDSTLARIAQGQSIAHLEALALNWAGQDLAGHISSLQESVESLEPEIHALAEEIGREKNELSRMDGADKAARINEELEAKRARISRTTHSYIQTMLAAFVLRQEIERFRQEHQNPLLSKASEIFQTLTLESFSGLRADLDEADRPILLGIRGDDQRVPVEGMSSGTRDQLYLALRLASLVWQAELSGPMPFIVDDVLINFDEDRVRATLQVLAQLSEKFQIILFTHQAVVRDLAMGLNMPDKVFVHHL